MQARFRFQLGHAFRIVIAGAEVGEDQIGQARRFGELRHALHRAVRGAGPHFLQHGFRIGGFMHEQLRTGTGIGQ